MKPLISIKNLQVGFRQKDREIYAVNGIHLDIYRGETVAVVGESGCGKSLTALSVMGLLGEQTNAFSKGSIQLHLDDDNTEELIGMSRKKYDTLRGRDLSMIFQEPMTALNPLLTVGEQIAEVLMKHQWMDKRQALAKTVAPLEDVGISEAAKRMKAFPFQLSGGQKQRIAIAMSCEPKLLIADEPTTALDVTIQSQVLYLLKQIKQTHGTSILFITHNLGVVAQVANRVAVMYRRMIIENGSVEEIFHKPQHPYTVVVEIAASKRYSCCKRRSAPSNSRHGAKSIYSDPRLSFPSEMSGCYSTMQNGSSSRTESWL